MLFCSQAFLLFFAAVFFIYWTLPWPRVRVWLLLAASVYFYAQWSSTLAGLIVVSASIDYLLARGMDRFAAPRLRRAFVSASIVGNLSLLAYFKYANFFLHSLEEGLRAAGVTASLPVLNVLAPLGISFFTFESISYAVDVYQRKLRAERSWANFLLFILFFPHLLCGPIVRARSFLPQIRRRKRWDWARMQLGAEYFLLGLLKKLAIADRMAAFVDPVFADPSAYGTSAVWLSLFAYVLQIYCDFSGYSDMALGAAHLLGYGLARNFNMPYLSGNFTEFWRRWHISLSNWLRDYLFIPLGGSRGGFVKTSRNLMVTMTLCGLWHGANWNCLLFGAVHGLLLIVHRVIRAGSAAWPLLQRLLASAPGRTACVALTFLTWCLTLMLLRAPSFAVVVGMARGLVVSGAGGAPGRYTAVLFAYVVVCLGHGLGCWPRFRELTARLPSPLLGSGYCLMLLASLLLAPQSGAAFIYFQF
jgi:alginate O-acetyltransferase complex protein AlgI